MNALYFIAMDCHEDIAIICVAPREDITIILAPPRQDECAPRGRPPAWPLPLSRPAVRQGAEIVLTTLFYIKFL